jgi:hypothetical protein
MFFGEQTIVGEQRGQGDAAEPGSGVTQKIAAVVHERPLLQTDSHE